MDLAKEKIPEVAGDLSPGVVGTLEVEVASDIDTDYASDFADAVKELFDEFNKKLKRQFCFNFSMNNHDMRSVFSYTFFDITNSLRSVLYVAFQAFMQEVATAVTSDDTTQHGKDLGGLRLYIGDIEGTPACE